MSEEILFKLNDIFLSSFYLLRSSQFQNVVSHWFYKIFRYQEMRFRNAGLWANLDNFWKNLSDNKSFICLDSLADNEPSAREERN